MSIITISRGSYSSGKEIAESVANELGYECVDREVFLEASGEYNLPEIKLVRAIHDAPSILERLGHSKEKYIAKFQAAFLKHMKKDNVVYHGLAGHYFIQNVPHVLKVRIIADVSMRVAQEVERENIAPKDARSLLMKDDEERRRWSEYLFGIDTSDSSLYDMVFNIHTLTTHNVADAICRVVQQEQFQATSSSRRALDDLLIAAEVKLRLIGYDPYTKVACRDGLVTVTTRGSRPHRNTIQNEVVTMAKRVSGVADVEVQFEPHTDYA